MRRVGWAIIISNPTSASGITVLLLKRPQNTDRESFPTIFVKTADFQLVFNTSSLRKKVIAGTQTRGLAHLSDFFAGTSQAATLNYNETCKLLSGIL